MDKKRMLLYWIMMIFFGLQLASCASYSRDYHEDHGFPDYSYDRDRDGK